MTDSIDADAEYCTSRTKPIKSRVEMGVEPEEPIREDDEF